MKQKNSGITLISLLITIIILILLTAITIASINKYNVIGLMIKGTEQYASEQNKEDEVIKDKETLLDNFFEEMESGKKPEEPEKPEEPPTEIIPVPPAEGNIEFESITWNNGKANITVKNKVSDKYNMEYKINDGTYNKIQDNAQISNLDLNSKITVRLYDDNGYGEEKEKIIEDNTPPKEFNITVTDITERSFKISASTTDAESGILKYEYYVSGTKYTSNNITGLTPGTTYNNVYVIAYDKANNETKSNVISVETPIEYLESVNATQYREQIGKTFAVNIKGSDTGSVWGSSPYTDDSNIAKAAVHAGLVKIGETKTVKIIMTSGQSSYASSTKNGITTSSYGSWPASFMFEETEKIEKLTNMMSHRGEINSIFLVEVTGTNTSTIWGDDIYTDDSNIATAAVHAGVVKIGETKVVKVQILAGQSSYNGSTKNGVTSNSYGSFGGSYKFVN